MYELGFSLDETTGVDCGASHRVDVRVIGDDGARRTRVRTTNLVVDGTSVDVVVGFGFTSRGFSIRAIDRWIVEGQRGRRGRGLSRIIIAVGDDAEPGVREQGQVEIQGVAREEVGERR